MPSLVVMALQADMLLSLLQALHPPAPAPAAGRTAGATRCEHAGFRGWHSILGAGAGPGMDGAGTPARGAGSCVRTRATAARPRRCTLRR
jgi:hypothetical protein